MSFRLTRGDAEKLRMALLMEEGVGTIAVNEQCLRVAFSNWTWTSSRKCSS